MVSTQYSVHVNLVHKFTLKEIVLLKNEVKEFYTKSYINYLMGIHHLHIVNSVACLYN